MNATCVDGRVILRSGRAPLVAEANTTLVLVANQKDELAREKEELEKQAMELKAKSLALEKQLEEKHGRRSPSLIYHQN